MDAKTSPSQQTPPLGDTSRTKPVRMTRWFVIVGAALLLLVGAIVGFNCIPQSHDCGILQEQ